MRFKIFATSKLTKGPKRSVIQNLITGAYHTIPNELYAICKSNNGKLLSDIQDKFGKDQALIVLDYIHWLAEMDYAELINEPITDPGFIPMLMDWDHPSPITNAIIDFGYHDFETLCSIRNDFDHWNTTSLELRFFTFYEIEYVLNCLELFSLGEANSLNIVLKHGNWNITDIDKLFNRFISINKLLIFGAKIEKDTSTTLHNDITSVFVTPLEFTERCCGVVSRDYFVSSVPFFTESQKFNSCLNRKISIDQYGEIPNCPSMPKSFGNISTISLRAVLETNESFKEFWEVTKKDVVDCNVCEFRNMCPDCRAYTMTPNHQFGKPTKCNYDPYTATFNNK